MIAEQSAAEQNSQDRSSDVRHDRSNENVRHGTSNEKKSPSEKLKVDKKDRTGKQKYYGCSLVTMKARDQPATRSPDNEREHHCEYKGVHAPEFGRVVQRSGQDSSTKYRVPPDAPRAEEERTDERKLSKNCKESR